MEKILGFCDGLLHGKHAEGVTNVAEAPALTGKLPQAMLDSVCPTSLQFSGCLPEELVQPSGGPAHKVKPAQASRLDWKCHLPGASNLYP